MEFIHHSYQPGETIAAIATPLGEGGIAVIRISGSQALDAAAKLFSGPIKSYKTHTAHFGQIHNQLGEHVDDVLVLVMLGTRSYTGEDTVEIHCHGGSLITRRVLEVVIEAGARQALPGEFTFKAFMHGKVDLAQAEAVQALIAAKNERALDAADRQLQGALSGKITSFQEQLTGIAAILEAWVDFPEEGLEFATMDEVCADLEKVCVQMQKLVDTFHEGKIMQHGIALCLVGCPNVGKSSLMNALLDKERAIVSHIPGTTRDLVEDHLYLNGLHFRLIDTAGVRESDEIVEQEGIRRTKVAMNEADLVLLVLDAELGLRSEEEELLKQLPPSKTIVAWNKMDLATQEDSELGARNSELSLFPHVVHVSAKERRGLDLLHKKIDEVVWREGPPSKEEVVVTQVRHKEALCNAIEACQNVIKGLKTGVSAEFVSMDMRQCLAELGKIIGTNITEDILTSIFSTFCIGK